MSAAPDLSRYSREDIQRAPLVWRRNGSGSAVRVRDTDWIVANLTPQKDEVKRQPLKTAVELSQIRTISEDLWFDREAASHYHETAKSGARAREVLRQVLSLYPFFKAEDIMGYSRTPRLITARMHVTYEIRRRCKHMSLPRIGVMLQRDHSTIFNSIREWPARAETLGIPCKPIEGE